MEKKAKKIIVDVNKTVGKEKDTLAELEADAESSKEIESNEDCIFDQRTQD